MSSKETSRNTKQHRPSRIPDSKHDPNTSQDEFKHKFENSKIVPNADRIEGSRRFIQQAEAFAKRYDIPMVVTREFYYLQVALQGIGGPCSRDFCKEFSALLSMCDRFSMFTSLQKPNHINFALEYDTHDFYFGDKRFNDIW